MLVVNKNYYFNVGKLVEDKFAVLPLGSIKVNGWLNNQLVLLRNGLTEEMEIYPDYDSSSAWLGGNGEDWERGPYYLRGLIAVAYQLQDEVMIERAQKWIDAIISSQSESGYFGPKTNNDWWPRMPVLMALRDYYEATGEKDKRILPFMEKYFRYQEKMLPQQPLHDWAVARGGDNMDSVLWLYNRLYDENNPEKTDWLIKLAETLKSQTKDWVTIFSDTTAREHVVNTSQAMKMPVVSYQISKDEREKNALKRGMFNISLDHGRIDELPNSDEKARDNRSMRGTELCGIVEGMLSTEIAMRILGEGWLGDHLETLAYNALPAAYSPDYLAHVYFILQNQVLATRGRHEFDCDHGDSSAFSSPCGFDCCFANNHMGWPKFFQTMWMATRSGGLAVIAYGDNEVTAKVANGKTAVFKQITNYPFRNTVKLEYSGEEAEFELLLRVPKWSKNTIIKLNGKTVSTNNADNGYVGISNKWTVNDVVDIEFDAQIKPSTWYNNTVAIKRGALIYSLKIEEDWRNPTDNACREIKVNSRGKLKNYEVYPKSRWNYALVLNEKDIESSFEVEEKEIALQPFKYDSAPIEIKATGQIVPDWKIKYNYVDELPFGVVAPNEAMQEKITLIPYGCGRLKITQFPKVSAMGETIIRSDVENMGDIQAFENVVVAPAKDYNLKISYEEIGKGEVIINGLHTISLDFDGSELIVHNLKSFIDSKFMAFNSYNYNKIYFKSKDVKINSIEIIPTPYEFSIKAIRCFEAVQIEYTVIHEATHYHLICESEGGEVIEINDVKVNQFHKGECFEADKCTVNVENNISYKFKMIAYKYNTKIAESEVVTI